VTRRILEQRGIDCRVIEPASLQVIVAKSDMGPLRSVVAAMAYQMR